MVFSLTPPNGLWTASSREQPRARVGFWSEYTKKIHELKGTSFLPPHLLRGDISDFPRFLLQFSLKFFRPRCLFLSPVRLDDLEIASSRQREKGSEQESTGESSKHTVVKIRPGAFFKLQPK